MGKFYLMRHGETDMNIIRCMQGRTKTKLNDTGRAQAAKAGKNLEEKGIRPTVVYCSPLDRARETAEIATGWKTGQIQFDDRLMEMAFGKHEGTRTADMPEEYKAVFFDDPKSFVPKDGEESYTQLRQRTTSFLKEVFEKYKDSEDTILIVTHGAVIHDMLTFLRKLDLNLFWKEVHPLNCQVFPITDMLEQAEF